MLQALRGPEGMSNEYEGEDGQKTHLDSIKKPLNCNRERLSSRGNFYTSCMTHFSLFPSVLALKDVPETWNTRLQSLEIPIAGVHYDIGDGAFVPSVMLPSNHISFLDLYVPIDVHLMVQKPSLYFSDIFAYSRVNAVAFHVESAEDIHENIHLLHEHGLRVGLGILESTPASHLDPFLLEIDYVVCMTIVGGYSGTPFLPSVLPKIEEIHHKRPELPIIVDGGIAEYTLPLCVSAGASGAVMSSALFSHADISWLKKFIVTPS